MEEHWKEIKGFPNYLISDLGRVYSLNRNRCLKARLNRYGYEYVTLSENGVQKALTVHRLVATHFIENPENKPEVNHVDGNKTNNDFRNLEFVTRIENQRHAVETGLVKGLKQQEIERIRCLYNEGNITLKDIAKIYGVNPSSIRAHVKDLGSKDLGSHEKLKPYKIKEIRDIYKTGNYSQREVAEMCEVSRKTVCRYCKDIITPSKKRFNGSFTKESGSYDLKIKEIRDLYETGNYSQREVAEMCEVSLSTVHRHCKDIITPAKRRFHENKNEGKSYDRCPASKIKEIRNLYKTGKYSQREVAEIFEVSQSLVRRHCKDIITPAKQRRNKNKKKGSESC